MVIGLNLKNVETDLSLFTMLNKKLSLNQLIDSEPITWPMTIQMSINKSVYHSKTLKVLGIISITLILMSSIPLKPMSTYTDLPMLMK
jgi:hypothetical protein